MIESIGEKKILAVNAVEQPTLIDYNHLYDPVYDPITSFTLDTKAKGPFKGGCGWTINFHGSDFCFTIERHNGPGTTSNFKHVLAYKYRVPVVDPHTGRKWFKEIAPIFTEKLSISTPESHYHNHETTGYLWSFARPTSDIPASIAKEFPVMIVPYEKHHIIDELYSRGTADGPVPVEKEKRAKWESYRGMTLEKDGKGGVSRIHYLNKGEPSDYVRMEALAIKEDRWTGEKVLGVTFVETTKNDASELVAPECALFKITSVYEQSIEDRRTIPWYNPTEGRPGYGLTSFYSSEYKY